MRSCSGSTPFSYEKAFEGPTICRSQRDDLAPAQRCALIMVVHGPALRGDDAGNLESDAPRGNDEVRMSACSLGTKSVTREP